MSKDGAQHTAIAKKIELRVRQIKAIKTISAASESSLATGIANSYLPEAPTASTPSIEVKAAKMPKSEGLYSLVSSGAKIKPTAWLKAAPEIRIMMLLVVSSPKKRTFY
jgi:hypothetical protein